MGRYESQLASSGDHYWLYALDTTSGALWLQDANDKWLAEKSAPTGAGPVGRYHLATFANANGAFVFVQNTETGETWQIDGQNNWNTKGIPGQ